MLDRTVIDVPPGCQGLVCNVTSTEAVARGIAAVIQEMGRLCILINNAGVGVSGDVAANDDAEWHSVFDVNMVGLARVSRAALPYLR